jgi:hypothetical protein
MFVDSGYLQLDDGATNDEDCNQDLVDEIDIIDIGWLTAMDEDSFFDNVDVLVGSFAPMDRTLAYLHEIMTNITIECTTNAIVESCVYNIISSRS